MITHAQASISFLQQHERDHEPTNDFSITELRAGPAGLTTRQSCTGRTPFSQIHHHLNTLGPLRRVQACPVLLFGLCPWTAHKPRRCCDSAQSSFLFHKCTSTTYWDPFIHLQRGLSSSSGPLLPSQGHFTLLSHTSEPQETQPCLAETAFPFHYRPHPQLLIHPPTAHGHFASSLQHPKQPLRWVWELFVGRSHSWLTGAEVGLCIVSQANCWPYTAV